ncbi:MAG: polyamine aminopropyltransferase [Myxococcales bacterium]|jgi:spermidine synthase|nr:polyamine aminopropyltransferase [Deltaproteobacteria bacterium]NOQ84916.1 polyamine aminopropyltransferase [Myxococcales bacterium]MBW2188691.1 polyamine aminopropyltransferase [Deltaproteobacteria bacterium]MBW2402745.1 polyamine aminopropyltransferase [Deltaproteobacteria bacterium]MBW2547374.1 polyamine aminopropyltransferase [Deltaproteobacteria bacterium]
MGLWYDETFHDHTRLGLLSKETLFSAQSPYQKIEVIDTVGFGRVLIIDNVFMTSEYDEFLYHEMLTHPALTTAPSIERVLVIGGGDGGTVREVLRHPDVKECVMIEIDEMVVEASKQHLPGIGTAWDDPRLDVRFIDAIDYVKKSTDASYDVILLDGTDPVGPGAVLFDESFYADCKRMLNPDGVMALQSESPLLMMDMFVDIQHKLRALFSEVHPYLGPVPLYGAGTWSWTWCSNTGEPLRPIPERQASIVEGSKAYNEDLHQAVFALPNYVKRALKL